MKHHSTMGNAIRLLGALSAVFVTLKIVPDAIRYLRIRGM
jgi:hypothetical protein